jgi:hypothetical protein
LYFYANFSHTHKAGPGSEATKLILNFESDFTPITPYVTSSSSSSTTAAAAVVVAAFFQIR